MRVAIVHDWLINLSGAERVLIELNKIFPEAPIYTLFADKKFVRHYFPHAYVRPSFLQLIPGITRIYKKFIFLMPTAVESFDLSEYDTVISSSAIFSKGLVLKPRTRHICYCYSPTRQLWDLNTESQKSAVKNQKAVDQIGKHLLRLWDRQASDRVDDFVAISEHVRQRIRKYYRRESEVIYPPVSIKNNDSDSRLRTGTFDGKLSIKGSEKNSHNTKYLIPDTGFYLIVSRLFPHKNIDIAIEAFNKLKKPLLIIGKGPEREKLKSKIEKGSNIKLLGFVPDSELPYYYQNCRAFIMPQEEDFGLTPIEAMAYGKPVLALRQGGATETIIEGKTGEFFDDPIPEALADGIRRLNDNYDRYDSDLIRQSTAKFLPEKFKYQIQKLVYNKQDEVSHNNPQL